MRIFGGHSGHTVQDGVSSLVTAFDRRLRLCLHWMGYAEIRLGLDPLWYGSTLFTRDRFKT